jgi:hypothetical protein
LAVAIWCAAVARASPSVAYFRFPLTGHFDSLSTTIPTAFFFDVNFKQFLIMAKPEADPLPKI